MFFARVLKTTLYLSRESNWGKLNILREYKWINHLRYWAKLFLSFWRKSFGSVIKAAFTWRVEKISFGKLWLFHFFWNLSDNFSDLCWILLAGYSKQHYTCPENNFGKIKRLEKYRWRIYFGQWANLFRNFSLKALISVVKTVFTSPIEFFGEKKYPLWKISISFSLFGYSDNKFRALTKEWDRVAETARYVSNGNFREKSIFFWKNCKFTFILWLLARSSENSGTLFWWYWEFAKTIFYTSRETLCGNVL